MQTRTVRVKGVREGDLAAQLRELQERSPDVALGSYPWYGADSFGAHLVARSADPAALDAATDQLLALVRGLGVEPELVGEA